MPRQRHTPKDRAHAALGIAQRAYDRARAAQTAAEKALDEAETAVQETARRLEHRKADPDLRDDPQLPIGAPEALAAEFDAAVVVAPPKATKGGKP